MPVGALGGASKLLHDFQDIFHDLSATYGEDPTHVQDLKVQQFTHGSETLPGLATTKHIKKGETILLMPEPMMYTYQDELTNVPGFGHLKDDYEKTAFWLAQNKLDLVDHPPSAESMTPHDKMLVNYIAGLPKLKDYKDQGMPLAASYDDLHKLEGLPHLGDLVKFTDKQRESLLDSWADYSKSRGTDAKFGYTDALWALATVRNRGFTFPKINGVYLAPVGDMPNFAGSDSNTIVGVKNDMVELQAANDIKVGGELTLNYSNGHPAPGVDLLAKHGFINEAARENWSAEDCALIQKKLPAGVTKRSKMLEAVGKLVDRNCTVPDKVPSDASTAAQGAAPAEKVAGLVADSAKTDAAANSATKGGKVDIGKDKAPAEQMMNPLLALASPFPRHSTSHRSRGPLYSSFL